jgi:hypothetical protein
MSLFKFEGALFEREFGDLSRQVSGNTLLQIQALQVGTDGCVVHVHRFPKTTACHIGTHHGIQFGKDGREFGPLDHFVGNGAQ